MGNRVLDIFRSYYGGLLCVCWSPDGKYILTGGQDDLVTIWSFPERKIIARCQGHNSWVSAVAFDPWRCDEKTYRFGSVGDDCQLLLWDFSVGMLHRPRAVSFLMVRRDWGTSALSFNPLGLLILSSHVASSDDRSPTEQHCSVQRPRRQSTSSRQHGE